MTEIINYSNFDEELFYEKSKTYKVRLNHVGVTLMQCHITDTTIIIQREPHSEFISVSFIPDLTGNKVFEIYHCLHMDIDTAENTITLYT